MKFSFPFFGKKTQSEEQKNADSVPRDIDIPFPEIEKVSINWNSVKVDPMPGLEVLPEQIELPVSGLSSDQVQTPPFAASDTTHPQPSQQLPRKAVTSPLSELKEPPQEEDLDETMPLQKVSASAGSSVKPLEIHDLVIAPAPPVPEVALESKPVPKLVIETVEVSAPELALESTPMPKPEAATETVTETAPDATIDPEPGGPEAFPVPATAPVLTPASVSRPELVIEAVEDFVPERVAESAPKVSPVEPTTTLSPVITSQSNAPSTPPVQTSMPASPAIPLKMTREDVIAAYKIFLNRLPESFEVIQSRLNSSVEANLIDFALADEFIRRADLASIVFPIAKKIIEASEQERSTKPTASQVVSESE